jgi:ribose 5-phosphate isomerase B
MNLLVLGARVIGTELAKDLSLTFLKAQFTKEERHQRRLGKILKIEERYRTKTDVRSPDAPMTR